MATDLRIPFIEGGMAACVHLDKPKDQMLIAWARETGRLTPPRPGSVWHDKKNEARPGERRGAALQRYRDWLEGSDYPRRIMDRLRGRVMACQCENWICTMSLLVDVYNSSVKLAPH